jgi:hypothetical protein
MPAPRVRPSRRVGLCASFRAGRQVIMTITKASKLIAKFGSDGRQHQMSFDINGFGYLIPTIVDFGGRDEQVSVTARTKRPLPPERAFELVYVLGRTYQQQTQAMVSYCKADGLLIAHAGTTVEDVRTISDEFRYVLECAATRLVIITRQVELLLGGAGERIPCDDDLLGLNFPLRHFPAFDVTPKKR